MLGEFYLIVIVLLFSYMKLIPSLEALLTLCTDDLFPNKFLLGYIWIGSERSIWILLFEWLRPNLAELRTSLSYSKRFYSATFFLLIAILSTSIELSSLYWVF